MARKQLGAAPANPADTATKAYVDAEISAIELTPGASGASGAPGASGATDPAGPSTVSDNAFTLQDDTDPTKQARFQLSDIGTGTTRTYNLPNVTSTVEVTANKNVANGYAGLDANGFVPLNRTYQLYRGSTFQVLTSNETLLSSHTVTFVVCNGGNPTLPSFSEFGDAIWFVIKNVSDTSVTINGGGTAINTAGNETFSLAAGASVTIAADKTGTGASRWYTF